MIADFTALSAPFAADRVSWRVGSTTERDGKLRGMALAYIDARDVMDRLDAVCSPSGWQCDYPHANGKTVCRIGLRVGEEWIWKADGAGDTDYEAEKGALSDAFKRAAVRWGIGRYLYDLDSPWVECEKRGKTAFIAKHELPRLEALLRRGQASAAQPLRTPPRANPDEPTAMSVDHMLYEIGNCSGDAGALAKLKADAGFRAGYAAADEPSRKRIVQALTTASEEVAA